MEEISSPLEEKMNESVDDILNDILGEDGGVNDEFTEMYAKYLGGDALNIADTLTLDLSDRSDEPQSASRVEYEDPDLKPRPKPDLTKRITARMPAYAQEAYVAAERQAQRPEFTSGGEVRYPSMGVGESEERVVFDADWEERAKEEAAKREAIKRDNMLRGDSLYARSFVAGGRPMNGPVSVNPAYIDPLSDDDLKMFEPSDESLERKRQQSLQEAFGSADEERSGRGFFGRRKKK